MQDAWNCSLCRIPHNQDADWYDIVRKVEFFHNCFRNEMHNPCRTYSQLPRRQHQMRGDYRISYISYLNSIHSNFHICLIKKIGPLRPTFKRWQLGQFYVYFCFLSFQSSNNILYCSNFMPGIIAIMVYVLDAFYIGDCSFSDEKIIHDLVSLIMQFGNDNYDCVTYS